jgi:hypothetical protein
VATKQDQESSRKKSSSQRTSTCEECHEVESVYVCPGCQIRTCSLKCVQAHKERAQCSGKRNRSEFLPVCRMNDNTLRNDYFFLEDVLNQTSNKKLKTDTANSASPNKNRRRLVSQAQQRGVTLQLMPSIMERSKKNSSFYSAQKDLITWRVEVIMVSDPANNVSLNLCENETNVMTHIEKRCNQSLPNHSLFMKLPARAHNSPRYIGLEPNDSLQQSLRGQTIIEHPTILCVPEDQVQEFPTGTDKIETIDEQPTKGTDTISDEAANIETQDGDLNP